MANGVVRHPGTSLHHSVNPTSILAGLITFQSWTILSQH
ncbi:hypothetical Protein YC6258_05329 [Gynuella sunshinyii YC6258]|uniref:Uncharacterized protein n=1 Tax=Gynuella sunshinyii YC6258 TaxID=1445510 RepID=A0A0C5W412_9GAMM|nr:hypothetical Protein YC6258_05329 [Gynuella sunshinyii YC6258]